MKKNAMVPLSRKAKLHTNTTFLMLNEGKLIFNGSLHELVHSENEFVREFLE